MSWDWGSRFGFMKRRRNYVVVDVAGSAKFGVFVIFSSEDIWVKSAIDQQNSQATFSCPTKFGEKFGVEVVFEDKFKNNCKSTQRDFSNLIDDRLMWYEIRWQIFWLAQDNAFEIFYYS